MIKLILAIIALALAGTGFAGGGDAVIATKAPPVAASYDWTGVYVGSRSSSACRKAGTRAPD